MPRVERLLILLVRIVYIWAFRIFHIRRIWIVVALTLCCLLSLRVLFLIRRSLVLCPMLQLLLLLLLLLVEHGEDGVLELNDGRLYVGEFVDQLFNVKFGVVAVDEPFVLGQVELFMPMNQRRLCVVTLCRWVWLGALLSVEALLLSATRGCGSNILRRRATAS